MNRKYLRLSNKVIKSVDSKGKELFFTKAEGAVPFQNTFFGDEVQYEVSANGVEIEMNNEEKSYTDAVILTFGVEEEDNVRYADVIICDLLGTFISDWY